MINNITKRGVSYNCFIAMVPAVVVMHMSDTCRGKICIVVVYLAYRSKYHYRMKGNRL